MRQKLIKYILESDFEDTQIKGILVKLDCLSMIDVDRQLSTTGIIHVIIGEPCISTINDCRKSETILEIINITYTKQFLEQSVFDFDLYIGNETCKATLDVEKCAMTIHNDKFQAMLISGCDGLNTRLKFHIVAKIEKPKLMFRQMIDEPKSFDELRHMLKSMTHGEIINHILLKH